MGCGKERGNVSVRMQKNADVWIAIWEELNTLRSKDAWSSSRRHSGGGKARQSASFREGKGSKCRSSKSLSLKAMRKRMSERRKERCWTEDAWRRSEQAQSRKKEKYTQTWSMQSAFIAWWKHGETAKS